MGVWIDSEAHSRFGLHSKYSDLINLHRGLHSLGQRAISLHAKGESAGALLLPQIQQQRDLFLTELRVLIG